MINACVLLNTQLNIPGGTSFEFPEECLQEDEDPSCDSVSSDNADTNVPDFGVLITVEGTQDCIIVPGATLDQITECVHNRSLDIDYSNSLTLISYSDPIELDNRLRSISAATDNLGALTVIPDFF